MVIEELKVFKATRNLKKEVQQMKQQGKLGRNSVFPEAPEFEAKQLNYFIKKEIVNVVLKEQLKKMNTYTTKVKFDRTCTSFVNMIDEKIKQKTYLDLLS